MKTFVNFVGALSVAALEPSIGRERSLRNGYAMLPSQEECHLAFMP
jgi:hypothetical protein